MSWNATPSAAACGSAVGPRTDGAQHRQHLQPDHRGRAVHVDAELGERRVVGDVGVHPHRGQEVGEVPGVDRVPAGGVGQRGEHRLTAVGSPRSARASSASSASSRAALAAVGRSDAEVVDDLVGVPGEAVEGVHGGPAGRRQQPGGQEVGAAVPGVQRAAGGVGGPQRRVGDPGGVELSPPGTRHRRLGGVAGAGSARPARRRVGRPAHAGAQVQRVRVDQRDRGQQGRPARSRSGTGSCRARPRRWGSRRSPASARRTRRTPACGRVHGGGGDQRHAPADVPGQRGRRQHGHREQHHAGPADGVRAALAGRPPLPARRSTAAARRRSPGPR